MIFYDILVNLNDSFHVDDERVLFNEFMISLDKNLDISKFNLNYEAIDKIFKVKLNKEEDFYTEFRKKVLRLDESPYYRYSKLKQKIQYEIEKIEIIINKLETQISELKSQEELIKEDIETLRTVIGKKKWVCDDCEEEIKQLKKYTVEKSPSISLKIKKCIQYKRYLNQQILELNNEWDEKKIKRYSLYGHNIEDIFIDSPDDLFDKDTDYNVNVKVAIHTRKMIDDICGKIRNIPKDKVTEYIMEEKSKNKYATEIMESLYLNNKEKYYQMLKEYMQEENILDFIVNATKENFFIEHRIEIIKDIKVLYENCNYQTCICIIPLQIEGILYDYCEELGIVPDTLNNFTMGTKITEIDKVIDFYLSEYLNYNMQIIRNKIAHGLLYEDNEESVCNELILDLASLIYLINCNNKLN